MKNFLDTLLQPAEPLHLVEREPDFVSLYLDYTRETECPTFFHRWTALTCLSAFLGRSIHFQHGHFTIHPNLYVMLIGSPGTKKSSAIKIGAKLLSQAGYTTFAAKKTRQEKFLLDLAEQAERYIGADAIEADTLDDNLFGDMEIIDTSRYDTCPPCEVFVAADEFNNFIGLGNLDFISILGELWDYDGLYDHRLKGSKSVHIPDPTVSILGGNTPTGFAQAFPTETLGQGFFSRLLLVYGEPSGILHTFPPPPNVAKQKELIHYLVSIKENVKGEMQLSSAARELMERIYHTWPGMTDLRFEHYVNRRLTHLIKLTLVVTASRLSTTIEASDIIYANTMLSFTEQLMPKALGEFGKARHSDVTHKIMTALDSTGMPINFQALWKICHQDLDSRTQMSEIINNLIAAEKIQAVTGGYLPIKKVLREGLEDTTNWNLLTPEERGLL